MLFLQNTITQENATTTTSIEDLIDFSLTNPIDIPLGSFILNLFLTIVLTLGVSYLYSKYGNSISK